MVLKLTLNKKVSLSVTLCGNDTFFLFNANIFVLFINISDADDS